MDRTIVAENLVKEYDKGFKAVDDVSFIVESGEVFGFLGPNGAGKSTTVIMLTTLALPTKGQARVGGFDVVIGFLRRWRGPLLFALALLAIALAFRLTPLHELLDRERLRTLFASLASSPLGALGAGALFVCLASFGAPITALLAIVGALFPAPLALAINTLATLISACPAFAIGRRFPALITRRAGEGRLERLRARIGRNQILSVAIVRNLPVAPFAVANGALGVVGLAWTPYLLGTLLGMAPGVVLITLLGDRFIDILRDPTPANVLTLLAIVASVVALAWAAQRFLPKRATDAEDA